MKTKKRKKIEGTDRSDRSRSLPVLNCEISIPPGCKLTDEMVPHWHGLIEKAKSEGLEAHIDSRLLFMFVADFCEWLRLHNHILENGRTELFENGSQVMNRETIESKSEKEIHKRLKDVSKMLGFDMASRKRTLDMMQVEEGEPDNLIDLL